MIVDQPCLVLARKLLEEKEAEIKAQLKRDGTPKWVEDGLNKMSGQPTSSAPPPGPPPSLRFFLDLRYGTKQT